MFSLSGTGNKLCDGASRREFLRVGGLTTLGLALPQLLSSEAQGSSSTNRNRRPRAKSCVLFFLEGGPSHIDLWDLKPEAPVEIRGEFRPISTNVSGITLGEVLPRLAGHIDKLAQVRSVTHRITDHNAGTYYAMTGRWPMNGSRLIVEDGPGNFPNYGGVMAKLRPTGRPLPDFIHLPRFMSNRGVDIAGQSSGFLGSAFDPFVAGDPSLSGYRVPGLDLQPGVSVGDILRRTSLLDQLDGSLGAAADSPAVDRMNTSYRRAMSLLTSAYARRAFDLSHEPLRLRERYGMDYGSDRSLEARKFGGLPHLGQCLLLTRRLVEAGVRLVTTISGRRIDQAWDTHRQHFPLLRRSLCPSFDQAFSVFLEDMSQRGLLDETLIVVMGEFGRTPRIGQVVSNAGAARNGRDHWPFCYTVMFAGAGIRGGSVYGSSDRQGAYPSDNPVTPEDITATIYDAMGIDPETEIHDQQNRPHRLILGRSILPQLMG
ncbi:MAG: DUF1501 domain-containing protein [Gemmataceae bacterium]